MRLVLKVFEEVGFQVGISQARDLFKKAGATVDESTRIVKMPRDLVMELVGTAPSNGQALRSCSQWRV